MNFLGIYSLKKLMVLGVVTMEIVHLNVGDGTSSSSVGPMANATDVLQPIGLLYSPYPPPCLDVPTFAARYPHVHNDARDPSSKRWNYVGEN